MSEERLNEIESTIKELSAKVAHLDKSFVEVNVTLRDYAGWTKELSNTIKELSSIVRDMNNQHQQIPYERIRDIQSHIDPVRTILRSHEEDFIKKSDANSLVAVAVFFLSGTLIVSGLFVSYVMTDLKDDILEAEHKTAEVIDSNTKSIELHVKDKEQIMDLIESHKKAFNE